MPRSVFAQAQSPNVALSWNVPATVGCATPDEIELRLAQLTDHRFAVPPAPLSFRILVNIVSYDGGWRARIALVDLARSQELPVGAREVATRMNDCRTIDVPVVLVIATLLDDLREQTSAKTPKAPVKDSVHDHIGIGAAVALQAGLTPDPRFGATLGVQLPWLAPIVIDASTYLPYEELSEGRGARVWPFHGGASVCPRLLGSATSVDLQVCAGVQAGALWGQSLNLSENQSLLRGFILLGIEPRFSIRLVDGVWAQLSIAANWLPLRAGFEWQLREQTYTLETARFAVMARIGVITFYPSGHAV